MSKYTHDRTAGRRRWLAGAALLALCAPLAASQAAQSGLPPGMSAPAKPTAMPAFELPTTAGTNLRSQALQGHVLVIRFWASW